MNWRRLALAKPQRIVYIAAEFITGLAEPVKDRFQAKMTNPKVAKRLNIIRAITIVVLVIFFVALCYYTFSERIMVSVKIRGNGAEATTSNAAGQVSKTNTKGAGTTSDGLVYRNQKYAIEVTYPSDWTDSGDASSFTNPDLLAFRQFVPNGSAQDFIEHPQMMTLSIFNKNPESVYQTPKVYIDKQHYDEWDRIRLNGYIGTKITHTVGGGVEYVFERNDILYVFYATDPTLLENALRKIEFF